VLPVHSCVRSHSRVEVGSYSLDTLQDRNTNAGDDDVREEEGTGNGDRLVDRSSAKEDEDVRDSSRLGRKRRGFLRAGGGQWMDAGSDSVPQKPVEEEGRTKKR
jgi:hypothetical protein